MVGTSESPDTRNVRPRHWRVTAFMLPAIVLLGAGGFLAGYSGNVLPWHSDGATARDLGTEHVFVSLAPVIVNLGSLGSGRHLRLTAEIEVTPTARGAVKRLEPRIRDVMNGYLRALDPAQIEAAGALVRIRLHLLRRIEMIVGPDRVRDLLITEFVVN